MILVEALRLNNRGVSLLTRATISEDDDCSDANPEDIVLRSFAGSLVAVQRDIQLLSTDDRNATGGVNFRARPIVFFLEEISMASSPRHLFVFQKALEAIISREMDGKADAPSMTDAVFCSSCVIFNMALVHHQNYLRYGSDELRERTEELYHLSLQVLQDAVLPCRLPEISLWIQLGALNNLGTIKAHQGDSEGSRLCFLELLRLLNMLELESKTSGDSKLCSLIDETEWAGMTSNCLSTLFQLEKNVKVALAA
jgi:hypothetical protein